LLEQSASAWAWRKSLPEKQTHRVMTPTHFLARTVARAAPAVKESDYCAAALGTASRPILLTTYSVNQTLPSGPHAMVHGLLSAVGTGNSVKTPDGVMLAILLVADPGF
jgi:hypothetical protein